MRKGKEIALKVKVGELQQNEAEEEKEQAEQPQADQPAADKVTELGIGVPSPFGPTSCVKVRHSEIGHRPRCPLLSMMMDWPLSMA